MITSGYFGSRKRHSSPKLPSRASSLGELCRGGGYVQSDGSMSVVRWPQHALVSCGISLATF
eukprot:1184360-Prorocentrum_minimum.AAC.2